MTRLPTREIQKAFDECYLVPKVLGSVEKISLETKILGKN